MIDFSVAFDKLAQFETSDELADFFRSEGVKAFPCRANLCPISHWLKNTIQKQYIYSNVWGIRQYDDGSAKIIAESEPTSAMKDFIIKFDHFEYTDLLDENVLVEQEIQGADYE